MQWQKRRETFRKQLDSDECVYPASVFDPLSARIADELEFEMAMFAGSVASMTVLGNPDLILLTLSEFAEQAYRINRACELPLLVDADHGYGNALNVMRTIEELEHAGVAGLSIEDTLLPQQHGQTGKAALISIDEGIGKMRAAVEARQDPHMVIAARTSAPRLSNLDDTKARIQAYQQTGVDALFVIGVSDTEELKALASVATLPLILGGADKSLMDRDRLAESGVRICLQGHQPFMAAMQGVYTTLAQLRSGVSTAELKGLPDKQLVKSLTREDAFNRWMKDYL